MSQPPSNPYPGSYPPPQQPQYGGGYPQAPQEPGGYPQAPQQPGGYPQQPGGYPGAGQPGFGAPAGPPPKKKSSVGKILLIILAVVVVLCVGGGVTLYFVGKDAVKEVVDASKIRLDEPETLGGRPKVADPELQSIADEMKTQMKGEVPGATSVVGGIYGDPAKEDTVLIAGASALLTQPKKELATAITSLTTELGVTQFNTVEAGPLGGEAKCGDGKDDDGDPIAVCVWADRGSLGIIIMFYKPAAELQPQFVALRAEIEKKA